MRDGQPAALHEDISLQHAKHVEVVVDAIDFAIGLGITAGAVDALAFYENGHGIRSVGEILRAHDAAAYPQTPFGILEDLVVRVVSLAISFLIGGTGVLDDAFAWSKVHLHQGGIAEGGPNGAVRVREQRAHVSLRSHDK